MKKYRNKKVIIKTCCDSNPLLNSGMDKQCRDYRRINKKKIKHILGIKIVAMKNKCGDKGKNIAVV